MLIDVEDVEISNCTTHTPNQAPVIHMKNVDDAFVHGCRAMAGTGKFIQIEGPDTQGIVLTGNSLSRAAEAVSLAQDVRSGTLIK
jgi:hypothetical protein